MAIVVFGILLLHAGSLACLLLLARHSVQLVNEDGRPVIAGAWREHVVPQRPAPHPPRHERA